MRIHIHRWKIITIIDGRRVRRCKRCGKEEAV